MRLWDVATGQQIRQFKTDRPSEIKGVAFSADGKSLALLSYHDPHVYLLEVATGKPRARINTGMAGMTYLTMSADGRMVVSTDHEGRVRLWDTFAGEELGEVTKHSKILIAAAFSPDGRQLATGCTDGTYAVWDLTPWRKKLATKGRRLQPQDLESAWSDLGNSNCIKAYQAMWKLTLTPDQTVAMLKEKLVRRAPPEGDALERLDRLIADLDNKVFKIRERAAKDVDILGEAALASLQKAVQRQHSGHLARYFAELQEKRLKEGPAAVDLRELRCVEILERIANPGAKELLKTLT